MKRSQIGLVFIVIMIIISVLIIVMLKWQFGFSEALKGKAEKDRCKLSVTAASKLRLNSFEVFPNIDCCQQNYVLEEPDDVTPTLANALYDCYDQFLKGEANLFTGAGRFCFLCSTVQFSGAASQGEISGFYGYLFNEKVHQSRKTYAREFFQDQIDDVRQSLLTQNPNLFELALPKPPQGYSVLFVHDRGESARDLPLPHLLPSFDQTRSTPTGAFISGAVPIVPVIIAVALVGGIVWYVSSGPGAPEFYRSSFSLLPLTSADLQGLGCEQVVRPCAKT